MPTYKTIIKSTGLVASVQVVQIFFGLLRNKVVAILLGAKGFGIWGLYNTYIDMVTSFSSLGLDQSGVRQIAQYEDTVNVAKCIWVFKRALIIISSFTALLSIIFSKTISLSLFNSTDYYWGVIVVSFVILFNGISRGQIAILNGLRNLRKLAVSQIIGAVVGSIACIALVYFLGIGGIPFFLFTIGLTAVLSTWWYVKKMKLKSIKPSRKEVRKELKHLLLLGLGFSMAGIIATLMTWLSRVFLMNSYDISAVGIYQASWTISNIYIGTILSAMGVDFMPRIMKLVQEPKKVNETVNEQIEFGVLVSSIGVVGILIFSPLVLQILYSSEFILGVNIIRWQVLGVSLRVIAFPFSYVIMAYNKPLTYVIIQSLFWTSDFLLLMFFSKLFGFEGLGINYFVAYVFYLSIIFFACKKICGFNFSRLSKKIFCISFVFITLAWNLSNYSVKYNYFLGSLLFLGCGIWIYFFLKKYMQINIIQFVKYKLVKKHNKKTNN